MTTTVRTTTPLLVRDLTPLAELLNTLAPSGGGVIVRYKGVEYGCTGLLGRTLTTFEGVTLPLKGVRIRVGTLTPQ